MRYSFLVIFLLVCFIGFSQTKIHGTITNVENSPLQGANIIVSKPQKDIIVSYAIANADGAFSLNINSKLVLLDVTNIVKIYG